VPGWEQVQAVVVELEREQVRAEVSAQELVLGLEWVPELGLKS
jgi:hypothetical protein